MSDFEPINGQKLCEYANRRFGWRRFASNGCGVLAIYNALGLIGRAIPLEQIYRHFQAWYRPRFFGIRPIRIAQYLKKQNISFQTAQTPEQLDEFLKSGGVAVVSYWNRTFTLMGTELPNVFRGAHFVTIGFDERYTIYNRFSNRNRTYAFDTLDECLANHYYMKGFFLTKSDT